MNSVVEAFEGGDALESARLRNVQNNQVSNIPVSGAFIYVGQRPRTAIIPKEIDRDETGYILTNENMETSVPGIFAAGDVRRKAVRQIATAVGDATVAALAAEKFLLMGQCLV